ncbi:hypothetical protein [Desulfopila aestuarii]|nr:hypothetical protein [Desulfopila aestuarii]
MSKHILPKSSIAGISVHRFQEDFGLSHLPEELDIIRIITAES